jgi:ubiquinol-cytochrome c reductase iron-sulfur subunit
MKRRNFLAAFVATVGGIGAAVASVPFFRSFLPSKRAKALGSPISVDISGFSPGEMRAFQWRGRAILILRRTKEQLDSLALTDARILDGFDPAKSQPVYVDDSHRARTPEFLVLLGNCTHLGCVPQHETEKGRSLMGGWWPGGFTCACHGSVYDVAGRVVRGPAPRNLFVPPYYFESETTIVVGAHEREA